MRFFLFCFLFCLFFFPTFAQANQLSADILIFSPHSDDEILCREGVISKVVRNNKKAKIVFLTNDNASGKDAVFLNYPAKKLLSLWEKDRNNLLAGIKDVLKKYTPKKIYIPYPLNIPKYLNISEEMSRIYEDRLATSHFVSLALNKLMGDSGNKWVHSTKVTYYFSNDLTNNKSSLKVSIMKPAGGCNEVLWDVPCQKDIYLKQLEEEWQDIAKTMKQHGYNVNFAPVVGVMDDSRDMSIRLVKRERAYSEDPHIVAELALAVMKGMDKEGVIPVLKHFPGLGSARFDTHIGLPQIKVSEEELFNRDLEPFNDLIKKKKNMWVMVNHAIYPCLDNKPASLSYKIQTDILREKLGFKGIIIVDELLNMQAISEFAYQEGIKKPYIGEIVVKVFQAGADIALIYPLPRDAEEVVSQIVQIIKKAVRKGEIGEKSIDESVKRILEEKERIFKRPLKHLLKDMSLEEKIYQRLIIDMSIETEVFRKYNLGGLHVRGSSLVEKIQENAKIPLFIIGQHEGGGINDPALKLFTRSAYSIGKEFERLVIKSGGEVVSCSKEEKKFMFSFDRLNKERRREVLSCLLASMDELIVLWSEAKQKGYTPYRSNLLSPLAIYPTGEFITRPFQDLPIVWVKRFSSKQLARCAYELFKKIFEVWSEEYKPSYKLDGTIINLKMLRNKIEKVDVYVDKSEARILCLAAHPDDEDGEALVYFNKLFGCSTYILLATRGEGGENLIGPYLGKELGIIRTKEMEQAAFLLGVNRVYYLGKKDFGYCLDIDEAVDKWGEQDTLKKIVYFYRLIRPHIIITKHTPYDGHCQHQAFLSLAKKAFELSGNSKCYPEMIEEGLSPWQPLEFYQRTNSPEIENAVLVDANEIICSGDKTINQAAYEALKQHRSQIQGGCGKKCGREDKVFYQLVKSKMPVNNKKADCFFDGISLQDNLSKLKGITLSGMPGVKIVKNLKIGLVEEDKNTLFIALKTLGCDFKKIEENFLKEGNLSEFDTIIVGQRINLSFSSNNKIRKHFSEFVKNGGNLIVFAVEYGRLALNWQPYPLNLSFSPIVDENSPVTILTPGHTLFNYPNKINSEDFKGWVQERGLSFPCDYSEEYIELTSCFSSKENLVKSGYLVVHYGKGSYICTSYSWHRQLREFHLGAYKNFANMLTYRVLKNGEN